MLDLMLTHTVASSDPTELDKKIRGALKVATERADREGYNTLPPTLHFAATKTHMSLSYAVLIQFNYRRREP